MPRETQGWRGPHPAQQKAARNAELLAAFWSGAGGTELARRFGICRKRVYQIVYEAERRAGARRQ